MAKLEWSSGEVSAAATIDLRDVLQTGGPMLLFWTARRITPGPEGSKMRGFIQWRNGTESTRNVEFEISLFEFDDPSDSGVASIYKIPKDEFAQPGRTELSVGFFEPSGGPGGSWALDFTLL
jgi:hypothetical protein